MKNLFVFLPCFLTAQVFADTQNYNLNVVDNTASGISFNLKYLAGVHKGQIKNVQGEVLLDENDQLVKAHFVVPISSIITGNPTRDCHMREALGINYQGSQFPAEHVCDGNNNLPASGPDSVVFPLIEVDFVSYPQPFIGPLPLGAKAPVNVTVKLKIHGVEKQLDVLPLQVEKNKSASGASTLKVSGQFKVTLADFGVVVKPFKLAGFEIGVDKEASVNVQVLLNQ